MGRDGRPAAADMAGDAVRLREDVTQLLVELSEGRNEAWEPLMASVYGELRRLAHQRLRLERQDTIGTTALVHEAYLKLVKLDRLQWQNRAQFFAIAAQAMRRILVDHARTTKRRKRGGGHAAASLDDRDADQLPSMTAQDADDLLMLDEALTRLGEISDRQRQVVELRFYGGLTLEEVAAALSVGVNTVKRDWTTARAWLNHELAD